MKPNEQRVWTKEELENPRRYDWNTGRVSPTGEHVMFNAYAALLAENAKLKEEIEFLKEPILESVHFDKLPKTGDMHMDIRHRHPMIAALAQIWGELLIDLGGPNFFTMELLYEKLGRLEITVAKVNGKSTSQVMSELREQIREARELLHLAKDGSLIFGTDGDREGLEAWLNRNNPSEGKEEGNG